MYYIVGLGNPGEKYEGTRHNIGREVVEVFAEGEHLSQFRNDKGSRSLQSQGSIFGDDVLCILPETYMNSSGGSVAPYVSIKNIDELIVIQDDIDLPLGDIKIVKGKGAGGHNGISSIEKSVKSKDFTRIKIGVAKQALFTKK